MERNAEVKRDARIGEDEERSDEKIKEEIDEEERMDERFLNEKEIEKDKREFEMKK
jgi:hypothetical protein